MSETTEAFLAHYGKKGMRWGVRNNRTAKEQKAIDKRAKIVNKRRTLSDSDLNSFIDRIQKEKRLKELVDDDIRPGRTMAMNILKKSGSQAAALILTGAMVYGVKAAISRDFKVTDLVNHIPRPKK